MAINNNSLRSDFYTEVYNIVNANVSDPLTRNKQWIFSSLPDVTAPNFIGYPILIISKAEVSKDYALFDNAFSDKTVSFSITVYTTSNAVLDTLSNDVDNIMTPSNLPQFVFEDYDETNGDINLGGKNVHFREMDYVIGVIGL